MAEPDRPDPAFDTMTARLLRREALRRAAEELSTNSPAGLEGVLARISAEVTADAITRAATTPASPGNAAQPGTPAPRTTTSADGGFGA
jgi:hypothetical protein